MYGFGDVALVDGAATLSAAAASAPTNPANPVLASVIDRNTGRLVTFGFIDPAHPDRPLNAKNPAASAVLLASGGMQLDTASRSHLLSATLERPASTPSRPRSRRRGPRTRGPSKTRVSLSEPRCPTR